MNFRYVPDMAPGAMKGWIESLLAIFLWLYTCRLRHIVLSAMFYKYKLIFIIPFNNIAMQHHLWCEKLSYVYDIAFVNTGTVKFYVKMTNKKINTRIKEHIADFRWNKRTTA